MGSKGVDVTKELAQFPKLRELLREILAEQSCLNLRDLAVNGNDLLALGIPRGRGVGLLLQRLLEAVMDGMVPNEHDALVQYAQYFSSEAKTN